jgi:archaellum component FlaF (FlaF/FlaG flagellin family)
VAITLTDVLGRRIDVICRQLLFPLGATSSLTIGTMLPSYTIGAGKVVVWGLNFDTYTSTATAFTVTAGQLGSTSDWVGSTAVTPNLAQGNLVVFSQTSNTYTPGTAFVVPVTVAGAANSTCTVTILGWFE